MVLLFLLLLPVGLLVVVPLQLVFFKLMVLFGC
jgi:hypothetical protein